MILDKEKIDKFGGRLKVSLVGFLFSICGGVGMMNDLNSTIGVGLILSGIGLIALALFMRGKIAELIGKWIG